MQHLDRPRGAPTEKTAWTLRPHDAGREEHSASRIRPALAADNAADPAIAASPMIQPSTSQSEATRTVMAQVVTDTEELRRFHQVDAVARTCGMRDAIPVAASGAVNHGNGTVATATATRPATTAKPPSSLRRRAGRRRATARSPPISAQLLARICAGWSTRTPYANHADADKHPTARTGR